MEMLTLTITFLILVVLKEMLTLTITFLILVVLKEIIYYITKK